MDTPCSLACLINEFATRHLSRLLCQRQQLLQKARELQEKLSRKITARYSWDADRPLQAWGVGAKSHLHASGYHPDGVGDEDVCAAS